MLCRFGVQKGAAVTEKQDLPAIPFAFPQEWEAWLEEHHATSNGTWLKLAKKGSGIESVSFEETLEVALCYGWIDSKESGPDDHNWLQRFTPRRARSNWSERNHTRATKLIADGRMKPSGLPEVERARADGRWHAAT
jgi:uncharacterized protein YdeI (YjbR/CyaY-like superfamily)